MERATPMGMGRRLTVRLGSLSGARPDLIEATISLWPISVRLRLALDGLIDASPNVTAESNGEPTGFALTERGLDVISACAHWLDTEDLAAT
jgi:hypothetical protein